MEPTKLEQAKRRTREFVAHMTNTALQARWEDPEALRFDLEEGLALGLAAIEEASPDVGDPADPELAEILDFWLAPRNVIEELAESIRERGLEVRHHARFRAACTLADSFVKQCDETNAPARFATVSTRPGSRASARLQCAAPLVAARLR